MNNEVRELTMDEIEAVVGGNDCEQKCVNTKVTACGEHGCTTRYERICFNVCSG